MPDTPIVFSNALRALVSSPDEVAQTLRFEGILGVRNAVRTLNPIVRYVQGRLRQDAHSLDIVAGNTLRVRYFDGRPAAETMLPDAVSALLAAFNGGAFPDLEMPRD